MKRALVRISNPDIIMEDHGVIVLSATVEYEDGGASGFPDYVLDISYLYRLFDALGIRSLKQLHNLSCWFLYEDGKGPKWGALITDGLLGIAPLHSKDGKVFIFGEWREWMRERLPSLSPYELRTGKKP